VVTRSAASFETRWNQFLVDAAGRSFITFEDYAVAILDEMEHPPGGGPAV